LADGRFAHAVHVDAAGLQPNRPHWDRYTALGAQSAVSRARTAPAPGAALDRLRFVAASCAHYELGYFGAYGHMAAEGPDLVLFLGDYIYEYNNEGRRAERIVRQNANPEPMNLAGYRVRYAQYRTDPDLQALHAAAPCLMTWDDRQVENDYADHWSEHPDADPQDFLRRRTGAYQACYEHMPLRRLSLPDGPAMRVYARLRFGRLPSSMSWTAGNTGRGKHARRPSGPAATWSRPPAPSAPILLVLCWATSRKHGSSTASGKPARAGISWRRTFWCRPCCNGTRWARRDTGRTAGMATRPAAPACWTPLRGLGCPTRCSWAGTSTPSLPRT
jgi:hypothetical protein